MTQNGDFSKGSIIKILMRLAIPMTLAQLMNVLYNVVDRMFIGRIGGDSMDALTGVGVCLPMITIVIAFANLVGMGGAPLFSIERGRKNDRDSRIYSWKLRDIVLDFCGSFDSGGTDFQATATDAFGCQ